MVIRHLVRIVRIEDILPIRKADAIEVARVGGWKVVVKKNEFSVGDLAVYFEIDSFLPQGNPVWQFLIDKAATEYQGTIGHVLRSVTLRGQLSQGLLLPLGVLANTAYQGSEPAIGTDVTEALGVLKYEPPIPECLEGLVTGAFPSRVPKTDQERIQNLALELAEWQRLNLRWELTEKLEGQSTTFAYLEGQLHVCAKTWKLADVGNNVLWGLARKLNLVEALKSAFGSRDIALQGELLGPGVEGNIYRFNEPQFYLYDVYDVNEGRYWSSAERADLARSLNIAHVPVLDPSFELTRESTMEALIAMADGESALRSGQRREGIVFKALEGQFSFKAVSNAYLTGKPLK